MTSQAYQADNGQTAQAHEQMILESAIYEDPSSYPATTAAPADVESATFPASGYPGLTAVDDDGADGPEATANNGASPSLVPVAATVPEPVTESHLGGNSATAAGPWNEIQAMFVDDPRASVERADGLLDDRVEAFFKSVTERQRSIQSAWQADDAGTEEMRVTLQSYRALWNSLGDLLARA